VLAVLIGGHCVKVVAANLHCHQETGVRVDQRFFISFITAVKFATGARRDISPGPPDRGQRAFCEAVLRPGDQKRRFSLICYK
jgi:hypothetical protein